jgi:hypothetical protein
MLIRIKLQWPALLQTLAFSAEHPRKLLLSINGFILLKMKSRRSIILSVECVAVDSLIANQFVIHLPLPSYLTSFQIHTSLVERLTRALRTLEKHISTRTFFVGERITFADLYIATVIQTAVASTFDADLRAQLPNLVRHLETIVYQPKLAGIYGEITYTEKAIQYTPPAKEKKEKEAPAPVPKTEKKPKVKEADEEEDDLVPAEPKVKNPLDDLPKSTFNLEDWKRAYSNKETRGAGGALEWLYQKYVLNIIHIPYQRYLTKHPFTASTTKDFLRGVSILNTTKS